MNLDWALLANHAEVQNGLVYINGGSIDTVNVQQLPAAFVGALVVRFTLHPTEVDRPHQIEIRCVTEDGQTIAQIGAELKAARSTDMPTGWQYGAVMAFNFGGLPLPRIGHYSFEILADNMHLKSLAFRVRTLPPAGPPQLPS